MIQLIADLHLKPEQPETTALFQHFMTTHAVQAKTLYVLGDLFEYWIGDDADNELADDVAQRFKTYTDAGGRLYLMHGNRDFLIGQAYATRCGAHLLGDEVLIDVYGEPTLLMHGDTLCSDDIDYQRFRKLVREPQWQRQFLAQTVAQRLAVAQQLRAKSQMSQQEKSAHIMDANQQQVIDTMCRHQVHRLIHGHTHRQATHQFQLHHTAATRIVLGDWGKSGCYCRVTAAGCRLVNFALDAEIEL